jgi:hypothetical protein
MSQLRKTDRLCRLSSLEKKRRKKEKRNETKEILFKRSACQYLPAKLLESLQCFHVVTVSRTDVPLIPREYPVPPQNGPQSTSISFPHLIFFSSVPLILSSFMSSVSKWLAPTTLMFDIPLSQHRPRQHRTTTVTFLRPPFTASTLLRGQLDRHSLNYRLILLHTHHKMKLPHLPFARPRTNTHIISIPSLLEKRSRGPPPLGACSYPPRSGSRRTPHDRQDFPFARRLTQRAEALEKVVTGMLEQPPRDYPFPEDEPITPVMPLLSIIRLASR